MDYFIKATDEQAMWSALEQAGLATKQYDPEDALNQAPTDSEMATDWQPSGAYTWSCKLPLDVIGTIWKPTGEFNTTDDGMTVPVMEALPGYHANLRGELTPEQENFLPLITKPNSPVRVWAGD